MSFMDNYPSQNVGVLPATPIQNYPQPQQGPDLTHLKNVFDQYMTNQQPPDQNGIVQKILANRFQPTQGDVGMSIANNAQSFLAPNLFQQQTPSQVMAQRYSSELSPYTNMLEAQGKLSSNMMNQAGGATGILINRYMQENPNASFTDALNATQAGPALTRMGLQLGPNNTVSVMPGAPASLGQVQYGKQAGEQQANLQFAAPIAAAKTGTEENIKSQYAPLIAQGQKAGTQMGETIATLRASMAQYPQLQQTVQQLSNLGKTATYTMGGQMENNALRQMGLPVPQSAVDRTAYISTIHNQLLPLLRQTFGAQFTEREGARLEATLGDPNLSPPEKDAALNAFITQKFQHIQSMQREVGMGGGQIPQMDASQLNAPLPGNIPNPPSPSQTQQGSATHRYNPSTGQLEPLQ